MTTAASTPIPSPEVLVAELPDGESVLLHLETGHSFGLDGLGTAVWELLVTGGDLESLVASTGSATGVDPETVRAGIGELVDELRSRGLVVDE